MRSVWATVAVLVLQSHMAVVGCADTIDHTRPPKEILVAIHEAGGLAFAAHVGWPEYAWRTETLNDWLSSGIDGFEHRGQALQFYPGWKKMENLPRIMSGTDSHNTSFGEMLRTIVFARSDDPKDIVQALKDGYCLGLTLEGGFGPDRLIDVFNTLMEKGSYLQDEYENRLMIRGRSLSKLLEYKPVRIASGGTSLR